MRKPGRFRRTNRSKEAETLRGRGLTLNQRFMLIYLVTIAVLTLGFSVFIFRNMMTEVVDENRNYQQFRKNETEERLNTNISSIDMSARLFQNDDTLVSVLNTAAQDRFLSTEQLISFHDNDVTTLDNIVHNNPSMYATRVYGKNDNVQEMMSIIFKNSRLKNLSWGTSSPLTGWHFNYADTAFSDTGGKQNTRLVSKVEAITDATYGTVGYVESAMTMEQMFPEMYGTDEQNFGFFIDQAKNVYLGTAAPEGASDLADAIVADNSNYSTEKIFRQEFSGRTYVVYSIRQNDMGIRYFGLRDITDNLNHVRYLRIVYVLLSLVFFILMGFVANGFITRMLNQLYEMVRTMQHVEEGGLSVRNRILRTDETGHLALRMNQMLDRINELMEENINRERLVRNAGMKALQNQINAHFIYNVLESIKMLAEIDEEYTISDSITSLGTLLRYSINWKTSVVTVDEEFDYIENYIRLMNLRNDFEVILSRNIPKELDRQQIPKMSLQPLVENAVLHGIAPLGEDATIYIKGFEKEGDVYIEVSDNGLGMDEETMNSLRQKLESPIDVDADRERGHGVGLKNVQDRIAITYGPEYGVAVYAEEGKYTKVVLHLPKRLDSET